MLNRVILSTLSIATLTCAVVGTPFRSAAIGSPNSASYTSLQLSNEAFHNPFVEDSSDSLNGLMITGCSQFGGSGPQVCLQWLGDALTTCLEWGDESIITACMQKGQTSDEDYETSQANSDPARNDWGFSVEFTLQ